MNNKEFLAGLSQKWGTTVSDTRKRVDNIVRVLGECFDDGVPVYVQTLGVFVVIKYKESIVIDNKKRRMLVPPRMELNLLKREQLPDVVAVDEKALSERLVGILGNSPEACLAIVESFFHTLAAAVDAELLVKVKGLGSFKAVSTKESKHIDTDTGETVIQTVSDEVSYTPDKAMRDVVNRPFAQFKPIELNEGVVFEDMEIEDEPVMLLGNNKMVAVGEEDTDEASEDVKPAEESTTATDVIEKTDQMTDGQALESGDDEIPSPAEANQEANEVAPEILLPEKNGEQEAEHHESPATAQLINQLDNEENKSSRKWLLWMIPAAVVLVALFLLVPRGDGEKTDSITEIQPVAVDSVQEKPALDFEAMNKRSPYGAYDIVGVDTTIVVRPGQSLSFICRAYIGPDMESYIQILNDIEDIHEGDTIMIPALQLRSQYQKKE